MLEGISCAGKTSVMYALKRLFAADLTLERNIVMLGEHYTQVLNSIGGEFRYHDRPGAHGHALWAGGHDRAVI